MTEEQEIEISKIEPGMEVETTGGALGETDVSKPRVAGVLVGDSGRVEHIVVEKGAIFKKRLEVPSERVDAVHTASHTDGQGKVVIAATEEEGDSLAAVGDEALPPLKTEEEKEEDTHSAARAEQIVGIEQDDFTTVEPDPGLLRTLGPGFLNGMAGNDSSAVTTYAVTGARTGYGYLWLTLLCLPILQACQYACAKIGRISGRGLSCLLKDEYGLKVAGPVSLALVIANVTLIGADLVAIGSGLSLITGISWGWFVAPVAVVLWYVTVYQDFSVFKKVFLAMSLVFVTYLVTAVLARPDWGQVLSNTFIPHIDFSFTSISVAVALLGATISPYQLVWQTSGEVEEDRPGPRSRQLRLAGLDVASGVVSGLLVDYAIIISTAATLFTKHQQINTAVDAAASLEPLVGPFAKYLFAVGLVGSGLIAIPVLLASTSYAVAETVGWPSSLSKKPWQNEGFYIILTVALVASLAVAAFRFDPIQLIFWANIIQGVLAPVLVGAILALGNNRKVMEDKPLALWQNVLLAGTVLLLVAGVVLLLYGMVTGQGGS